MTDWVIPCLLAGVAAAAIGRRTDVYGALTDGAAEGLRVLGRILPALVVLLSAVQMFRASGAMELLTGLLSPVLEGLGIPPETAVLLLVRPVSGSGALAVGSQLMEQYGPDSYIGRVTAVMLGCSETTFYTVAVYYGAAGIRRTRHTIPAALTADAADITITLCNNAGFELPFTGGTGFTTYFLLAALMLCMGVYFCKKSNIRKENN